MSIDAAAEAMPTLPLLSPDPSAPSRSSLHPDLVRILPGEVFMNRDRLYRGNTNVLGIWPSWVIVVSRKLIKV